MNGRKYNTIARLVRETRYHVILVRQRDPSSGSRTLMQTIKALNVRKSYYRIFLFLHNPCLSGTCFAGRFLNVRMIWTAVEKTFVFLSLSLSLSLPFLFDRLQPIMLFIGTSRAASLTQLLMNYSFIIYHLERLKYSSRYFTCPWIVL